MSPYTVLGLCHAFYYVHVSFNPPNSPMWEALLSPTSQMKSLMHLVRGTHSGSRRTRTQTQQTTEPGLSSTAYIDSSPELLQPALSWP